MNLTDYGKHRKALGLRGTSHVAVLKAIERGRIMAPAVERKGHNWEINPELADQQWADTTHPAERGSGHHRGARANRGRSAATGQQASQAAARRDHAKGGAAPSDERAASIGLVLDGDALRPRANSESVTAAESEL